MEEGMGTRHHHHAAISQQHGAAAMGKKHKDAGAEGHNRRALGDIGNLVNVRADAEGKPLPHVTRPVTRSFGAQLLRNAQVTGEAAGAAKKPVKLGAVNGEAAGKAAERPKKKVVVVQKPNKSEEAVVVISSQSKPKSKKKVHTTTSVLTARSKAASGITDKPKETVQDIDRPDAENHLAVVDYIEDIYTFYRSVENSNRPLSNYMDSQVEVNAKMRSILADWLIEVHHKFELMPETLYLTFYIIDRYLSMEIVLRRELQLVGVAAMLIACKYEEIWAPEVNDFITISDRAYCREQILAMEKEILNRLEWNLTVPTPYVFLVRFLKAALADQEIEHMVFFFAELGLVQYSMITYSPSLFAASAVYAARCTVNKSRPLWSETLRRHTGYSEAQLQDCAKLLVGFHSAAAESKLKVVHRKYSSSKFGAVALQPPASAMLMKEDTA